MTIEIISRSISTKVWTGPGLTADRPLDLQLDSDDPYICNSCLLWCLKARTKLKMLSAAIFWLILNQAEQQRVIRLEGDEVKCSRCI